MKFITCLLSLLMTLEICQNAESDSQSKKDAPIIFKGTHLDDI